MILEVLECDAPPHTYMPFFGECKRVVPAGWWTHAARNPKWVKVCRLRWWSLWRLLRLGSRLHYWPLRLKTRRGRIVWQSKAAGTREDPP